MFLHFFTYIKIYVNTLPIAYKSSKKIQDQKSDHFSSLHFTHFSHRLKETRGAKNSAAWRLPPPASL